MNTYILDRVRADARHALDIAKIEGRLQHPGMKGRFRELLIDKMLLPWLPPYISCGTGQIIDGRNIHRHSVQDDVIVFDKSLTPPILASAAHAPDGIFLFNSVIARIEVKSTLKGSDIKSFVRSSIEISKMEFGVFPQSDIGNLCGPFNMLFAYDSNAEGRHDPNYQLYRVIEAMKEEGCNPLSGVISMVCIPGYGFWKVGERNGVRCWERLIANAPEDDLAWFVGCMSNSCYQQHALRQGRDPLRGLESGIGVYFPHPFEPVHI